MIGPPSPNRGNGHRDTRGRFIAGNPGGPGNPLAARVGRLRAALLEAVTPEDIQSVVRRLVEEAREGDVAAARLVLERVLGHPQAMDLMERIEGLESVLARVEGVT